MESSKNMRQEICDFEVPTSKKRPWLSVIVPVYNGQQYLRQCLDSILGQTFEDFELLILDDGSTDQTPVICEEYVAIDHRVKHVAKVRTGCYHNRLTGFYKASGDYITTIDADDFYLSNDVFGFLYQKMQEKPCDLLQFGMKQIYRHLTRHGLVNQEECLVRGEQFQKNEYVKLFGLSAPKQHLFSYVHGKLFSRRLCKDLPPLDPPELLFSGEDIVVNLYLLRDCQSACFLPIRLYGYRETSGGTKRFSKTAMQDLDKVSAHKLMFATNNSYADRAAIEYRIFADIAGSLLCFTQDALRNLPNEMTVSLLKESLVLPCFQRAREYFIHNQQHTWTGAELLRSCDPEKYCAEGIRRNRKNRLRRSVYTILKKVYARL